MKNVALLIGISGLVASAPAFSEFGVISLHSVAHSMQTSWFGVDPVVAVGGLLIFVATVAYRLRPGRTRSPR